MKFSFNLDVEPNPSRMTQETSFSFVALKYLENYIKQQFNFIE
jgi:hypothetical protein